MNGAGRFFPLFESEGCTKKLLPDAVPLLCGASPGVHAASAGNAFPRQQRLRES